MAPVVFHSNGTEEDRKAAELLTESKIPFLSRGPDSDIPTPFVNFEDSVFIGLDEIKVFVGTFKENHDTVA